MAIDPPDRPTIDATAFWIETRLRDALDDSEVIANALAMLKVAHEAGDTPEEMMQKVLGDFVFSALKVPFDKGTENG